MQFLLKLSDDHLSKILAYFSHFLPDLSLIISYHVIMASNFEKKIISPGFPLDFRKSNRILKN